jgi:hypothetical protein
MRARVTGLVVLLGAVVAACSAGGGSPSLGASPPAGPAGVASPTAAPTASATATAAITISPTVTPSPTPTPQPLAAVFAAGRVAVSAKNLSTTFKTLTTAELAAYPTILTGSAAGTNTGTSSLKLCLEGDPTQGGEQVGIRVYGCIELIQLSYTAYSKTGDLAILKVAEDTYSYAVSAASGIGPAYTKYIQAQVQAQVQQNP